MYCRFSRVIFIKNKLSMLVIVFRETLESNWILLDGTYNQVKDGIKLKKVDPTSNGIMKMLRKYEDLNFRPRL